MALKLTDVWNSADEEIDALYLSLGLPDTPLLNLKKFRLAQSYSEGGDLTETSKKLLAKAGLEQLVSNPLYSIYSIIDMLKILDGKMLPPAATVRPIKAEKKLTFKDFTELTEEEIDEEFLKFQAKPTIMKMPLPIKRKYIFTILYRQGRLDFDQYREGLNDLFVPSNKKLIQSLKQLAIKNIEPLYYSRTSALVTLHLPYGDISNTVTGVNSNRTKPISFVIDTGAESNIIGMDTIKELGLEHLIDSESVGTSSGVGGETKSDYISYITVGLGDGLYEMEMNLVVHPGKGHNLLGLTTILFHSMVIDLTKAQLRIGQISIPITISDRH
jgi:hypothetical protein